MAERTLTCATCQKALTVKSERVGHQDVLPIASLKGWYFTCETDWCCSKRCFEIAEIQ